MASGLVIDLPQLRGEMIAEIKRRNIRDERILKALEDVPREEFIASELKESAYADTPLPIGLGQTISQPFIVAFMLELANLQPTARVLDVGTGSGYAAAVTARIAEKVFTIERQQSLFEQSRKKLQKLGYMNVFTRLGDGAQGWPEEAPFDAILVAAASDRIPPALLGQLKAGGRLIIPVGGARAQKLLRVIRSSQDRYEAKDFGPVSFVSLIHEL